MKTTLILILLAALAGAGFLTRPSQESFKTFYDAQQPPISENKIIDQLARDFKSQQELKSLTFRDRYLWVEMAREGKVEYIGALSHWIDRRQVPTKVSPKVETKVTLDSAK